MDVLKLALIVGIVAMVLGGACLGFVAWESASSRNLALATGTLVAAFFLFAVQLPFELRGSTSTQFVTAEFTINREKPEIRQWSYPPSGRKSSMRVTHEVAASQILAQAHPDRFEGDRETLTRNMVIFSILTYFGTEYPDWQLSRVHFRGQSLGSIETWQSASKPADCTAFSEGQVRDKLLAAGNDFAGANIFFGPRQLCLPPKSSLFIGPGSLVIDNPFCRISFDLLSSGSIDYRQPGVVLIGDLPQLANGEAKFETRLTGIRVSVEYSWMRAQHRDLKRYQDWADQVVEGIQTWFEGPESK